MRRKRHLKLFFRLHVWHCVALCGIVCCSACCSVLQCVAVCAAVCVAVDHYITLTRRVGCVENDIFETIFSVECVACVAVYGIMCCSVLQCVAVCVAADVYIFSVECVAYVAVYGVMCCSVLQCVAVCVAADVYIFFTRSV